MTVSSERKGDTLFLKLAGDINQVEAEELKNYFARIDLNGVETVQIDFSQVGYIGSAGVGKLLLLYKNIPARNAQVNLNQVPADIYAMFQEMELDAIFKIKRS